jgi:hypothetical protein
MESKKIIQLSFNSNIKRNLFSKTISFSENRKLNSKEKPKKENESKTINKPIKPFIYYHKIPKKENKKPSLSKTKSKILIDSKTEVRLPLCYIDLSYDNPINE